MVEKRFAAEGYRPRPGAWRPRWRRLLERRRGAGWVWWLAIELEPADWERVRPGLPPAELRGLAWREVAGFLDLGAARRWRRVRAPWLSGEPAPDGVPEALETRRERRRRGIREKGAASTAGRLAAERRALGAVLERGRPAVVAGEAEERAAILAGLRRGLGRHAAGGG